jgi:methylmalonyl-CoA/ethylmalonyl-CoA epimerase
MRGGKMIGAKSINHIGIAVRSIAKHRRFYETVLGARFDGIEKVASQKVKVGFFLVGAPGHEVRIELLEATAPDSPIATFIEKRGEGIHHLAYTVDDLPARLAVLSRHGVRLIDEEPRPGAHHTRIAFLHPKSTGGVLTELCEPAPGGKGMPESGIGNQGSDLHGLTRGLRDDPNPEA